MLNKELRLVVVASLGAVFAGTAMAAEPAHSCSSIADDGQRLDCYDASFGRPASAAPTATVAPDPAVLAAPAAVAVTTDPVEDFGLSEQDLAARDPEQAKIDNPDSITATVTEVGKQPRGEFIVTLDNGHVWKQSETNSKARLKVGDTVTIKKGALASYLLVTPSKVATRVKRVK